MKLFRSILILCLALGLLAATPARAVYADTLSVSNCNDSGAGSLRQAVLDAASGDMINFSVDCPASTPMTLLSTLAIDKALTISGAGHEVVISGGSSVRIFEILGADVSMEYLTLKDASVSDGGNGGAIYDSGNNLALSHMAFENNIVSNGGDGGAIYHYLGGSLTVQNSVFQSNSAEYGGAIFSMTSATVTNVTFTSNKAFRGGVYANYTTGISTFERVTMNSNMAIGPGNTFGSAGTIYLGFGTLNIYNSTLSGNGSADYTIQAGAIYAYDSVVNIKNSSIVDNVINTSDPGFSGGGVIFNNSTLSYFNTIMANNSKEDCYTDGGLTIAQNVNNLVEVSSGCGTPSLTADPNLGPLADNGGSTWTRALLAGSPAIDAGEADSCLPTDQRGLLRPWDGDGSGAAACDLGAYEAPLPSPVFADVPQGYWALPYIESLYANGVTGGCGGTSFCPNGKVTRGQMAVFLLKGKYGSTYIPPDATGAIFNDVPSEYMFAKWIEQLYNEGITGGCGGGNYCPNTPVTREQMAVFLLVAMNGTGYTPPAATGIFADVPADNPFAPWIEALYNAGITGGCGGGNFCPKGTVTRAQMAVFLVAAFNLP